MNLMIKKIKVKNYASFCFETLIYIFVRIQKYLNTLTFAKMLIMKGRLYLIPAPLGDTRTNILLPDDLKIVHKLNMFIAERAKTARHYLKALQTPVPFKEMEIFELNKHTPRTEIKHFLDPVMQGHNMGLVSEAGCPGVADPGAEIVKMAHKKGIEVIPMIGPSSILLALMASGMSGQHFAFAAYLPVKNPEKKKRLQQLEQRSRKLGQTQIFMETPYRNKQMLEDAFKYLSPDTRFCIACNLSLSNQYIETKTIREWKAKPLPEIHKQPSIFLIGH